MALTRPLLTPAAIPEQGSSSRTSDMAPAKEPLTLPQQQEEGVEGSKAPRERERCLQENSLCHKQVKRKCLSDGCLSVERKEEGVNVGRKEATDTGDFSAALGGKNEEEDKEEEVAILNQSQTKSKFSLLPQQSQYSSSSSIAKESGTLHSKTSTTTKPSPTTSTSPKHFDSPSSFSALSSITEVKDIKGDLGWISGFPPSFKSQQSTVAFPHADTEPASKPAEDDGLAGVSYTSNFSVCGAKAPEPNVSKLDTEMEEEGDRDEEQNKAILKNLNQDLSPNSMTSHMTIMHSRNSCKTLKCPKCNWHYKSQHTLQVHMKEKHPETGGQCVCGASRGKCVCGGATHGVCAYCSSGKPHPRLARGETYVCGYKPYRCEVCDYATSSKGNLSIHMQSDKHLNNVQNGGHSNGNVYTPQVTNSSSSFGGHTNEEPTYKIPPSNPPPHTPQSTKLTPPAHSSSNGKRWRCDVCDYETSIARNLRIHTTSEKHTHNLLRLQRGYYLSHSKSLQSQLEQLQSKGAELSLNVRLTGQQVAERPVTVGSALTPSPSPSPSPPPAPSVSPKATLTQGMFQCLVCAFFSSSSLKMMEQHLATPRSLPQSEWCSLVAGGCHCRLCGYTTTLRANFSLHCQTDRHRTRYQLIAHLKEGGDRGQEGAAIIAKGNPVQLRCNLCDYVTSSLEKLQGHSLSSQHKASARVYRFLQQYDGDFDGDSWLFHCLLCNHSCSSKLQVLKHSQTATHQQREELLQLQPKDGEELEAIFTIKKAPDAVRGEVGLDNSISSKTSFGLLETTKDTMNVREKQISEKKGETKEENQQISEPVEYECSMMENSNETKRPRIHQQNENQQTVQCPLCQVELPNTHLRQHLTHMHSVAQDCVDKIISTVLGSINLQPQQQEDLPTGLCTDDTQQNKTTENMNADSPIASDTFDPDESEKNKGSSVENTAGDLTPPKDVTALLTPPLDEGRPAPQSPSQIQPSLPHSSPPCDPPTLSDRHGYRYRCSRCSLAFPTQKKLHLHWQYHAMRAATECPLCSRQCRSQEALQRHMQNTHSQVKDTILLPDMGPYMDTNKNSMTPQDCSSSTQGAGKDENEEMEEEAAFVDGLERQNGDVTIEENMVTKNDKDEAELTKPEKVSPEEISEQIPSSPVKKGYNPTVDRYLDPSRPYKCTICSESFTQKTILLVHFNSVSHLHRARRALQESGTSVAAPEAPRGSDPRPYRCKLCGVGYSQSSTLDIHLRSVLHQTRIRAAQNPSVQSPASVEEAQESVSATTTQPVEGEMSNSLPPTKRIDVASSLSFLLPGLELPTEAQKNLTNLIESQQAEKNVVDILAAQNHQILLQQQQQLVQVQAQAQAQFQQNTALLQSQIMQHFPLRPENLLQQHFSLTPDSLLSLQQNLLLPFYLSGEMKLDIGPETCHLLSPKSNNDQAEDKTKSLLKAEKKQIQNGSDLAVSPGNDHLQSQTKGNAVGKGSSANQIENENHKTCLEEEGEKEEMHDSSVNSANAIQRDENDPSSFNPLGQQCPPPRVPYASVNGEPLRALLQSYGYELAMQYIQSKRQHQHQMAVQMTTDEQQRSDSNIKLGFVTDRDESCKPLGKITARDECENKNNFPAKNSQSKEEKAANREKTCCVGEKCDDCGKLFSDALLLKSHQEYIHRMVFPATALDMFSRKYRLQYDLMHPLTPATKYCDNSTSSPQAVVQITPTSSEPEVTVEQVKSQVKPMAPTPVQPVSDLTTKISDTITDEASTAPAVSSHQIPSNPEPTQEASVPGTSASTTPQTKLPTKSISLSLPKIPMLSLPLPQLPIAPLPLSKLPLPPIPFPMELPLIPPVVMHPVALQPQPWLDSNVNPEIAKLYQSQLKPPLLGQTPQLSPTLLGQPPLPSPVQTGQQSQAGPTVLDQQQQGKRTRTRISDEQLIVLKKHFDINSLPSDEEFKKISSLSGLPHKVIKHWFRNTLFKERQRDKDSPYNFNNPPTVSLEESSEAMLQNQVFTLSPCSLSPGLPASTSPHDQTTELHRGEPNRCQRSSRTRFTEQQLETLQRTFESTPYPREEEYDQMSAQLSLPNRVIVVWFQNARQRARKNQDRMADGGSEGKTSLDSIRSQRNENYKDSGSADERHDDSHNENSMDLSYEYYTQPESPALDSPSHCTEGKHLPERAKKPEEAKTSPSASESHSRLELLPVLKSEQSLQPEHKLQQESATQPYSSSTSENTEPASHSSSAQLEIPSRDDIHEKSSDPSPNLPSTQESNPSNTCLIDSTNVMSTETQPLQLPAMGQYQCSVCTASLPSFQLWQEHQTRHILAAQSQVQLLHSGFTERTLPYMMLHSNHTLMASQILSGAMSQIPFSPTHSVISHLNNLQMKSTLSEHSSNTLAGLSQSPVEPVNQRDSSFESQRGRREAEEEHRKDKRQRTTITPEQLEVLYHRYSLDSNPTRGVLESIARDIGLTRRVVQVWFQNTRARERKGQFRSVGPGSSFSLGLNHLRCPFCRAQFKVKSALDAHIRSRHRAEAERAGCILSTNSISSGQIGMVMPYVTDKPGTSIPGKSAHPSRVTTNKQSPVNPAVTALFSSTHLSKAEEEDDYEEIDEDYTFEECFGMADQESFSPENSVGSSSEWAETQTSQQHEHHHHHQQQQRQRTQMSHFQVLQLRDFYRSHRTPNRHECEALGQELGLPHRVVQVWFQNARAKEKRTRSLGCNTAEGEQAELSGAGERDRA